jgi:aspartate carbamoyltransferase regulatory subunit
MAVLKNSVIKYLKVKIETQKLIVLLNYKPKKLGSKDVLKLICAVRKLGK